MKTITKIINDRENLDLLIENLKLNNINFKIAYSSSKITLTEGRFTYHFYPNKLKKLKGLHFIKKLKQYILKNDIKYNFDLKIGYTGKSPNLKDSVNYKKDIYEIDLKSAYWTFAKKNGFISNEIYMEGLTVDKKIRLMSLGALAKNTTVFNYENGEVTNIEKITSKETEGIFFKVAFDTDHVMKQLIKALPEKDFMFYWVDAVFFRGKKNVDKIKNILKSQNIDFKVVEIKKVIKKKNLIEVEDFNFKKRDFNFLKQNHTKNF